jgi:hypothetical protein
MHMRRTFTPCFRSTTVQVYAVVRSSIGSGSPFCSLQAALQAPQPMQRVVSSRRP